MSTASVAEWTEHAVHQDEIDRYLIGGRDFINDAEIERLLRESRNPDPARVRDALQKSLALKRLEPQEMAVLLNVEDEGLWSEIFVASAEVKRRVYGPRIVTFAPLYCSNLCVNSCAYCAFRRENSEEVRRRLTQDEVREETRALVSIGHKRLIVVAGEHPDSDADYLIDTIRTIYDTKVGHGEIRRVNVNAAPQTIDNYRRFREAGIGTYQVFQETYHHATYRRMHPRGVKADYRWRLYAQHRAQDAGVDDVAIGALFGLADWRFEAMGLLYHTIDLEQRFNGVGPHTISFPRLEPAANTPFATSSSNRVSDRDFKRVVAALRLAVPYTGLIITARERPAVRMDVLKVGCTQTDASTRIGVGAYHDADGRQQPERQQFVLGDTRSLDEVIRDLASMGLITSFCTAGYRCGRTGSLFMDLAKSGRVHLFCMPNAILTFKEYLEDYGSPETKVIGEKLIRERLGDVADNVRDETLARLKAIEDGERDLRF